MTYALVLVSVGKSNQIVYFSNSTYVEWIA